MAVSLPELQDEILPVRVPTAAGGTLGEGIGRLADTKKISRKKSRLDTHLD
jgi:hypothetical protein